MELVEISNREGIDMEVGGYLVVIGSIGVVNIVVWVWVVFLVVLRRF